MQKVIKYALNPPCSSMPHTHYVIVAGDTMRYLLLNGDWFVFTFGWQYIQHEPHCTPVGEPERHIVQIDKPKAKPVKRVATEFPIYSNRRWKGD